MVLQSGHAGIRNLVFAFFILLVVAPRARAQGVGLQGGGSIDPEQFYIGSHFESKPIVDRLHFRPSIDGGFGGGFTLATIQAELIYKTPLGQSPWTFYQGGGPVIGIVRFNNERDVSGGLGGTLGLMHASGFFVEFRGGGGGGPNLKFGVGFTVRREKKTP
ncbi:MAG: hypothetical protein HY654_04005 [Acidobacteria bacterium]|nr:hypothetical protein [Acidobacteriota bacterium]